MTTLDASAHRASDHSSRPLAATVLAELLWRASTGHVPDGVHPAPLPAGRSAASRDGVEAMIRGPASVSFR